VPRAMAGDSLSTYCGDLINGAMQFNVKFTAMWAKDGYRDYLSPEVEAREEARDVLNRLMQGGASRASRTARVAPSAPQLSAAPVMTPMHGNGGSGGGMMGMGDSYPAIKESELSELLARRPSIADLLYRNMQNDGR
jgi:hypothetical protein